MKNILKRKRFQQNNCDFQKTKQCKILRIQKAKLSVEVFFSKQKNVAESIFLRYLNLKDLLALCAASNIIFDICKSDIIPKMCDSNYLHGLCISDQFESEILVKWFYMKVGHHKNIINYARKMGLNTLMNIMTVPIINEKMTNAQVLKKFKQTVRVGNARNVAHILRAGIVDPSSDQNWAIKEATTHNHVEVAKELIKDKRVDVYQGHDGRTWGCAMAIAVEHGHDEILALFLGVVKNIPSKVVEQWRYAIREGHAMQKKHERTFMLLLNDKRWNPGHNENKMLKVACANWNVKIVKMLLADERVDPTANDNTSLKIALAGPRSGHIPKLVAFRKIISLLLNDARVSKSIDIFEVMKQIK